MPGWPIAAVGGRRAVARPDGEAEARLIGAVAAGDRRAFEDLYRLYHPRLTRFLATMLSRAQAVEEALDDTMMVVWNRSSSFNGTSKVSTWVFAIAYRTALNALRRHDPPVEDLDAHARPSGEAGPEQQLGQSEVQRLLLAAMGELSEDHRAVVDLTYFHDLGYREIAQIMTCPVDTVKTRMFHARRHLRRKLAGELADWL
ncbi:MAG: sigma-70 family RNA polymerase sigma factor [Caulobacteraceae bacterium]